MTLVINRDEQLVGLTVRTESGAVIPMFRDPVTKNWILLSGAPFYSAGSRRANELDAQLLGHLSELADTLKQDRTVVDAGANNKVMDLL